MTETVKPFDALVEEHFKTLELYTMAITRAHGKNHPEAFEVRELFEQMDQKVKAGQNGKPNLDAEFAQLRQVTNNYEVPSDVCETYEGVYNMLSEIDQAYQA